MSDIIDYPLSVLVPTSVAFAPDYNTRPGHQATNGMFRSLGMSGSQFRLMLSDIPVRGNTEKARALRALVAAMESDRKLVRIRLPDLYGIDGPLSVATTAVRNAYRDGIPFATDALYATGVGHAVPTLEARFAAAAPINSRDIYVAADAELPAGCAISIDEFCYEISGSWTESGGNRIRISPPLRTDKSRGDILSLAPVFVGYCVTDRPGYELMRGGRSGTFSLEFVEDLTRLVEDVD